MILEQEYEVLQNSIGVDNINMRTLLEHTKSVSSKWENFIVNNENGVNFDLDKNLKLVYNPQNGDIRQVDLTANAFQQLCSKVGVPSQYVKKCISNGKMDLALDNFNAWAKDANANMMIREYDGVARAVLSEKYKPFDSHRLMKTLYSVVDDKKYQPNQVYLSQDKMHIRFVNFEPLPIDNDRLYSGFTVSSSDVGLASINVKYFVYRFACKNGIVVSNLGGTLFKQSHIGANMDNGKLSVFNKALMNIDLLNGQVTNIIQEQQKKFLKDFELNMYLEKARRDLRLSEKSQEKLLSIIDGKYNRSTWGVINGITELAQDFTLDTRIEFENWAGDLLVA